MAEVSSHILVELAVLCYAAAANHRHQRNFGNSGNGFRSQVRIETPIWLKSANDTLNVFTNSRSRLSCRFTDSAEPCWCGMGAGSTAVRKFPRQSFWSRRSAGATVA